MFTRICGPFTSGATPRIPRTWVVRRDHEDGPPVYFAGQAVHSATGAGLTVGWTMFVTEATMLPTRELADWIAKTHGGRVVDLDEERRR